MCGPKTTALPRAAGSMGFCPPCAVRPGHQHQEEVREPGFQPEVHGRKDLFLAVMGAARDEDLRLGPDTELAQEGSDVERIGIIDPRGVELQAADDMDGFRPTTQLAQSPGIGLVLRAHAGEAGEQLAEEEPEPPVTPEGTLRQPGIDQEMGDAPPLEAPQEIRPDLRLHQDHHLGIDQPHGPLDVLPTVDRVVDLGDVGRQALPEQPHARRRGGRDHDLVQGQQGFHRPDELGAEVHLAHADGMEPDHLPVGQRLLELAVIQTEALPEACLPGSSPVHLQEVPGSRQGEPEVEEEVVDQAHAGRGDGRWNRSETSFVDVAPRREVTGVGVGWMTE